ncbi:unnamed protein product, partial [Urochloa humidicola]
CLRRPTSARAATLTRVDNLMAADAAVGKEQQHQRSVVLRRRRWNRRGQLWQLDGGAEKDSDAPALQGCCPTIH